MPRQVDHAARRRLIAEAVCRLADERGLEGVTLRDVAAAAGVSMGAVQRCFGTKDEMLEFALGYVGARITERVRARLVRSPAQSAGTALGHAAAEVALLDAEHRAEARVWLAFVAQAAVSAGLAGTLRANYAALQDSFATLIAEGRGAEAGGAEAGGAEAGGAEERGAEERGAAPGGARRAARTLLALADGLTTHVLIGHLTPAEAHDVLDAHLRELLSGPAG